MLATLLVAGLHAPDFFAVGNILDVLKQGSVVTLMALALTIILAGGGFDMSVGALSQLTSNIAAGFIGSGIVGGIAGVAVALGLGGGVGLGFGAVNGLLIAVVGVPSFVGTLGMMFVAIGAMLAFNGGQALTLHDRPEFFYLGQGYIGPIPVIVLILIGLVLVLHVSFKRTPFGLRTYAVGEAPAAASLRGVSRRTMMFMAFLLGGTLAGVAGVLYASYGYGSSAELQGLDFLITALAAAFLGSALSTTGELDMLGTAAAGMFVAALSNVLILNGISYESLPVAEGIVLVLSVLVGVIRKRDIGQVFIF